MLAEAGIHNKLKSLKEIPAIAGNRRFDVVNDKLLFIRIQ